MNNTMKHARVRAKFVGYLVLYLEGKLSMLSPEQAEAMQKMMDNPPEHLSSDEVVPHVLVPFEDIRAVATDRDWALAQAIVDERARHVR